MPSATSVADRIDFRLGPWWQAVPPGEQFDLIVSNPPYIASDQIATLQTEVRLFDPKLALDGGWDGLERLPRDRRGSRPQAQSGRSDSARNRGYSGETVSRILSRSGFGRIEVQKDLAGLDRLVLASHS